MNVLENTIISTPSGVEDTCAKLTIDDTTLPFIFHNISQADEAYTLSFWVRSEAEGSIMVGGATIATTSEWKKHVVNFIADSVSVPLYFRTAGTYYIYKTQIEVGDHATDYRPAVEDVEEEVEGAKSIAIQTRDMFQWIVKSGDSETNFVLTDRMATLIADTISLNGNVKVNGSMIVDGTLTANKINLTDLFAQDITATGKIRGVELIGAKGTFTGDILVDDNKGHTLHIDSGGNIKLADATEGNNTTSIISLVKGNKYIDISTLGTISAYNLTTGESTSLSINGLQTYDQQKMVDISPKEIQLWDRTTDTVKTSLSVNGLRTEGVVTVEADTAKVVQCKLTNSLQSGSLYLSENGNLGIFSLTHLKWLVRMSTTGEIYLGSKLTASALEQALDRITAIEKKLGIG